MRNISNDMWSAMKYLFIILVLWIFVIGCEGGELDAEDLKIIIDLPEALKKDKPTLYPILDTRVDRYGFKNNKNQWVINPMYVNDGLIRLTDGYYLVKKPDGKGGFEFIFLDKYGENEMGKIYQEAYEFDSGIALVKINNRMAIINRAGKIVDAVEEQDNEELNKNIILDGRILVASGKNSIHDEMGKIIVRDIWTGKKLYEGSLHYDQNIAGRYVVINDVVNKTTYLYSYKGSKKTIKGYYFLRPGLDEMIMAPYGPRDPDLSLYVYNLRNGGVSSFPEWHKYGDRIVIEKILEFSSNKKLYVYLINSDTNILLLYKGPAENAKNEVASGTFLGEFSEGLAPLALEVRKINSYYYIDEDGQYVFASMINGDFKNAFEFIDGFALVQLGARREGKHYNDKWCYVDKMGNIVIREDIGYMAETGKWILN